MTAKDSTSLTSKTEEGEQKPVVQLLYDELQKYLLAAQGGILELNPRGPLGYHEIRAIRYAYCVLGWPPAQISRSLNRSPQLITALVRRRKFKGLRDKLDRKIIERATARIEADVEDVTGLTVNVIRRGLTDMIRREEPLTVKDMKLVSDITANYHRILQLIKGKPTSIGQTISQMTDADTRDALISTLKRMKEDPMFDIPKFLNEMGIDPEDVKDLDLDIH